MSTLRNQRGFGLVEMMVALVITGVVLIATYGALFRSQTAASSVSLLVENRQNARAAVQLLERELRMAGSGWGKLPVYGWYNNTALTLPCVATLYGGSEAANDTLGIMAGWSQATTLSASMPTRTTALTVASSAGFAIDDFVVVTDGASAHLFQITGIAGNVISHATTSLYNVTGTLINNFPASGYGVGSQVFKVSWVSYKVDTANYRRPTLVRWEYGRGTFAVAYNVQQFKLKYELQDGSVTRSPGGLVMVDKVIPVVTWLATSNGRSTQDSVWASIRPRTF